MSHGGSHGDSVSHVHAHVAHATSFSENPVEYLLQSPELWSAVLMVSLVGLLFTWEEFVANARTRLPATLMPVVDSMLAEMGGLGFIGLFLSVFVTGGLLGETIGELSEEFLGDEEILLETFEFLHTAFFEVGIAFFLISGLTVANVVSKIDKLQEVSEVIFDRDQDGNVSLEEIADVLQVDTVDVDLDGDGNLSQEEIQKAVESTKRKSVWDQVFMTTCEIRAEALVVRERFLQSCLASPSFRLECYFVDVFGKNLEEIVELSPLTWLPLVPAISLGRSVDMSRDIVSAASPNAAESCGYFLGSPGFFTVSLLFAIGTCVWGCFNFWKVTAIKEMLVPALVRDSSRGNKVTLLPPRYQNEKLMKEFNSSPSIFGWIESFFGKPARNEQEKLFGVAGHAGPELYRNSIKFQTWLAVSQIVFWGTQIVARDANALIQGLDVGNPELLVPELAVFSLFLLSAIGQLLLAPQTFLNYSLVTSVEELAIEYGIKERRFNDVVKTADTKPRSAETVGTQ